MEKNNTNGKTILFILLFGLIFIVSCTSNTQTPSNTNKKDIETTAFKTISSGSTQSGDVLIELTPREIKDGKLNVDFAANTHSVDLSQFDLMQITTLEYGDSSKSPESAPTLSGHHTSGTLAFDTGKEIKNFRIIIKGIPAVEERVFEWQ